MVLKRPLTSSEARLFTNIDTYITLDILEYLLTHSWVPGAHNWVPGALNKHKRGQKLTFLQFIFRLSRILEFSLVIRYYPEKYQVPVRLQQCPLSWFPYLPEEKFGHAFYMSPIAPSLVRKVLGSKKAPSVPGPDELMFTEAAFDVLFFGHSVSPIAPGGI
jgi:hypothetical protein